MGATFATLQLELGGTAFGALIEENLAKRMIRERVIGRRGRQSIVKPVLTGDLLGQQGYFTIRVGTRYLTHWWEVQTYLPRTDHYLIAGWVYKESSVQSKFDIPAETLAELLEEAGRGVYDEIDPGSVDCPPQKDEGESTGTH